MKNKGLQYALVIDDADSSINYHKSEIDCNYSNLSIDDLYELYKADKDSIFNHDTRKCVSLIDYDGNELSLHEFVSKSGICFIKIFNDELASIDNEILLDLGNSNYNIDIGQWGNFHKILNKTVTTEMCTADLNGYKNSIKIYKKDHDAQAINYCLSIKHYYRDNMHQDVKYQGYLPAIGQLLFIAKYLPMINYILKKIKCREINLDCGSWWSSTESLSYYNVYILFNGELDTKLKTSPTAYTLPLFKKIN